MKIHWDFLERRLSRFFGHYAILVSHYPTPFIVVPVIFCLTASYGFIWKFEERRGDLTMYTPNNARAKIELAKLEETFPINDSDPYFADRRSKQHVRSGFIVALPKNRSFNILNSLDELSSVWQKINDFRFEDDDRLSYTYENVCIVAFEYNKEKMCVQTPVSRLQFLGPPFAYPVIQISMDFLSRSPTLAKTYDLFIGPFFGKPRLEKRNGETRIVSAEALLFVYQLKFSTPRMDALARKWEVALELIINNNSQNLTPNFDLYPYTSETLVTAAEHDTKLLSKLFAPMSLAVTLFTVGCCFVNNMLRSKPLLGLTGIISAALSIVASMGLMLLCGLQVTSLAYAMPFLIFAVGVDNVFIFIAAWRKTSVLADVQQRMYGTFKEASVSIFVTAFTDALAFAVGTASNFPAVSNFCLFAFAAITLVFINQMTFFAGFIVVSGKRENQFRHCVTMRVMQNKAISILKEKQELQAGQHHRAEFTDEGISDHAAARFFRGPYTSILLNPFIQSAVVLSLYVYWFVSTIAVWNVRIGIHPTELVGEAIPARKTVQLMAEYFKNYSNNAYIWYTDLEDYQEDENSSWNLFRNLDDDLKRFENTFYTEKADSWYRQLIENQYFEKASVNFSKITADNSTPNFAEKITFVFSYDYFTRKYLKDLKFGYKWTKRSINGISSEDKRSTVISSTRFCVRLLAVEDSLQPRATMFLRHLAAKSPFKVEIYNEFFEYADQVDSIVPSIFTSLGIGTFAVVVTSLLFIPQPSCALWVCVTILSINLGTIGCMTLWNVRLDFVSMVTIVMSIGTSVDFAAHIAYHFARSHLQTAEARLRDTMYVVGIPIVQSAFSTMLGVIILFAIPSYAFLSFAKTATLVITFGLIHGIVILPVLLATFHIERSPCCMKIIAPSTDDSATTREKTHCKKCLALGTT